MTMGFCSSGGSTGPNTLTPEELLLLDCIDDLLRCQGIRL